MGGNAEVAGRSATLPRHPPALLRFARDIRRSPVTEAAPTWERYQARRPEANRAPSKPKLRGRSAGEAGKHETVPNAWYGMVLNYPMILYNGYVPSGKLT